MNRALIAVVAVIGLSGCAVPTGLFHSNRQPTPSGPGISGSPEGPIRTRPILLAGGGVLTDAVHASYVAFGSYSVSGKESTVAISVPASGTLSDLRVVVTSAPGTRASWKLTLDRNASATSLTCAIAGAATSCGDYSQVAVVAGDEIDLDVTPFGTPARTTITWSGKLTP